MLLRRILAPEREEEIGGGRNLHNEELYPSTDILKVIKSRSMR
jgi:hypothetical protein